MDKQEQRGLKICARLNDRRKFWCVFEFAMLIFTKLLFISTKYFQFGFQSRFAEICGIYSGICAAGRAFGVFAFEQRKYFKKLRNMF